MLAETKARSQLPALPCDCVLAFGIPTDEEDFETSIKDPKRDYSKHYLAGWGQYRRNFVSQVEDYTRRYEALGVHVIRGLQSSEIPALFTIGSVVTLFTHWTVAGVEFCDGILSLPTLVEAVPCDFSGVLDLCVCHPDDLAALLLRDRPLCTIRYLSNKASPLFWLGFYAALYELLALRRGRTYSEELTELAIQLRHTGEGRPR
jgi:hypothetical protein